jgi:hypothetical protein
MKWSAIKKKKKKKMGSLFSEYNLISTQLDEIVSHKNQGAIKKNGVPWRRKKNNLTIINKITLMAVTL